MFCFTIDLNYKGWEISLLETSGVCPEKWPKGESFPFVAYYCAFNLKSGVTMNTNTFDGIKRMIEAENIELRKAWSWAEKN